MTKPNVMWAVFKNGKQVSKAYPHKIQAIVELYERKAVAYGRGALFILYGLTVEAVA